MTTVRRLILAAGGAAAVLAAAGARAGVVLQDYFDAEGGGHAAIADYTGFANFNVTRGAVNLVFDLTGTCPGVASSCVNLGPGGTAGGTITTRLAYDYNPGDVVELAFFAGNRLGEGVNDVFAGFQFAAPTSIGSYVQGSLAFADMPYVNYGDLAGVTTVSSATTPSLYGGMDFIAFKAVSAGSVQAFFGSDGGATDGPVLDNVTLSIGPGDVPPPPPPPPPPAPEPSTWAMMLLGLGGLGALARSRRRPAAGTA